MPRHLVLAVLFLCFAKATAGEPKAPSKEPPSKLKAHLVVKKDTYELITDFGQTGLLNYLLTNPILDVRVVVENPTDKDIKIIINPDDGYSTDFGWKVDLKGPKVEASSTGRNPQKFAQFPRIVTIPAGKKWEQGVGFAWGGKRQWHTAYWFEPGEYTLRVRVVGDGKEFEGFVTEPVKLKVIAK